MSKIIKGNSFAYTLDRIVDGSAVDLTGYTLRLLVVESDGTHTAIDRMITELDQTNTKFLINLTPTETDSLTENSSYNICNRLENSVDDYIKDVTQSVKIAPSCFD